MLSLEKLKTRGMQIWYAEVGCQIQSERETGRERIEIRKNFTRNLLRERTSRAKKGYCLKKTFCTFYSA